MNSDFFEGWATSTFGSPAALTEHGKTRNKFYMILVPRRHGRSHIKGNYIGNRYVGWKETNYKAPIREKVSMKFLYYDLKHCGMLRGLWAGQ